MYLQSNCISFARMLLIIDFTKSFSFLQWLDKGKKPEMTESVLLFSFSSKQEKNSYQFEQPRQEAMSGRSLAR